MNNALVEKFTLRLVRSTMPPAGGQTHGQINTYLCLMMKSKKTCLADGMGNCLATVNSKQIVGLQHKNWFLQVCCL